MDEVIHPFLEVPSTSSHQKMVMLEMTNDGFNSGTPPKHCAFFFFLFFGITF